MSVEQYSNDVIVVTIADGPSNFKVWLREETPADLLSDLRWLCEEYMDSHVVLDLADLALYAAEFCLQLFFRTHPNHDSCMTLSRKNHDTITI